MVRGARDYSLGKIYKVVDTETNECYVGSTVMPLCKRLSCHKTRGATTGAHKHFSQAEVGWHRARIVLVEEYPCDNVDQLRAREEHHRVALGTTLNCVRAHAGLPEGAPKPSEDKKGYNAVYRATHAEERREYDAAYYSDNKEQVLARAAVYYSDNKEQVRERQAAYYASHTEQARARAAAYRAANSEQVRERQAAWRATRAEQLRDSKAAWYTANRATVLARGRERVNCPHCNTEHCRASIARHIRTQHPQPIQ